MYAALIDMSEVPNKSYQQVNQGFGNEFFVDDPSKAKVIKVFHLEDALGVDKTHQDSMPQNKEELKKFYINAQQLIKLPESFEPINNEEKEFFDKQWNKESTTARLKT